MGESFRLGETTIAVTRKDVKNVHLSVHPPDGHVTLVAPSGTRLEVARAFAITKLRWIHQQQAKLRGQARETPRKWERKLGVAVHSYYLQRMKTKWGSCNHRAGNIRLNTELVKKPRDLLEYVIVHEMLHLLEPTHSEQFQALMDKHYPSWREARMELNELPLGAV
ncbi:MAG TPA: SprT-like domain-containing protein [Fibrobacteria bacterium]|nr:SprT-like domain-containing protein [Fibrobacteria bacterium]HOX51584.1 SprT-like domain-containing protein [Fibrobacteria bacterium]